MNAINQWLETLGLGQYVEVFAANDIDMEVLPELTEEDLKTLGVSMGHRKKLMKAVVALSAPDTESLPETAPTPAPPAPSTRAPSEGERRQATVLFSDLSGYTAMNETLDPEEVEGLMSRIKAAALGIVERHGGIVNQFVGDEVLALFGIPTAHEDDPVRAVRAALEMHEMVRQMSPEVEGRIGQPLRLHTGINTGLIVTNLRDTRDGLIGITGDAVNTGARLKAEASVDAILVSPETKRLVADFYHTEALEPVEMKGKTQPVTPYCVLGKTQVASRFEAAAQRGLSKFTGREQELTVFHDCLGKAMAGQGQFLTVVGAAGVGKSRLLFEFRHSLDREKVTLLEGRCQSYGAKTPYFPWLDALRRGLQLRDTDTSNDMHQKVVTNVRAVDPSLERYLPFYLHLLSIPSIQYPLPAEFQGDELSRLFEEALGTIYTLRAQSQPMVAIFEDWHWVDEDSETAMKHLVGLMHSSPLLVVVLYRPEYSASWGDLSHHTPIVLQSLDHRHTQDIVRSALGAKELPEGLTSLIQERTGGNPFFIEEVCHALKAEGTVVVSEGRATLNRSLDALHIPDSVHAVIRTRVDRLHRDSQEALRLASVIGREFGRRILERMYSRQSQLLHTLEGLKIADLILQVRVLPEVEYMFKHVLTQVVVYETLLLQQRKDLHRLVARTIEDVYANRLEEQYKTLAYHYQRSTEPEKGVHYLERAGDCNKAITHSAEARRNYWEAIHALDALESTPERKRYRIDLNLKLASISADSAPSEEHIATLHRSIEYARELGEQSRLGQLLYWQGNIHFMMGRMHDARPYLKESIEMTDALQDFETWSAASTVWAQIECFMGEFAQSIANFERVKPTLKSKGTPIDLVANLLNGAWSYAWMGDFRHALEDNERAIEVSKTVIDKFGLAWSYCGLAITQFHRGDWQAAIDNAAQATEIGWRVGDVLETAFAVLSGGYALAMHRNPQEGLQKMQEAIHMVGSLGSTLGGTLGMAWLGEVHLALDNVEEAVKAAQTSLAVREGGERWGEIAALRVLARAEARATSPQWKQIDEHMQDSLRLAEKRQARPDLALSSLRYAEILQKKGDYGQANDYLRQATTLFQDMEMIWWLEQAETLHKSLAVR